MRPLAPIYSDNNLSTPHLIKFPTLAVTSSKKAGRPTNIFILVRYFLIITASTSPLQDKFVPTHLPSSNLQFFTLGSLTQAWDQPNEKMVKENARGTPIFREGEGKGGPRAFSLFEPILVPPTRLVPLPDYGAIFSPPLKTVGLFLDRKSMVTSRILFMKITQNFQSPEFQPQITITPSNVFAFILAPLTRCHPLKIPLWRKNQVFSRKFRRGMGTRGKGEGGT